MRSEAQIGSAACHDQAGSNSALCLGCAADCAGFRNQPSADTTSCDRGRSTWEAANAKRTVQKNGCRSPVSTKSACGMQTIQAAARPADTSILAVAALPVQRRALAANDGDGAHATRLYPGRTVRSSLDQVGHLDDHSQLAGSPRGAPLAIAGLKPASVSGAGCTRSNIGSTSVALWLMQGGGGDVYVIGNTMAGTTPDFSLTLTWTGDSPVHAFCRPATNTAADTEPPKPFVWTSSDARDCHSSLADICCCHHSQCAYAVQTRRVAMRSMNPAASPFERYSFAMLAGVDVDKATVFIPREAVEYFEVVKQLGNPIILCSVSAAACSRRWFLITSRQFRVKLGLNDMPVA